MTPSCLGVPSAQLAPSPIPLLGQWASIAALDEGCMIILEEGLAAGYARHERVAQQTKRKRGCAS